MTRHTLSVFDLDDTLFTSHGKVVVRDKVTNDQLRVAGYSLTEVLQPNEYFDYAEFRSSRFFFDHAKPISKMVKKYKKIVANRSELSQVCIVTARGDLDDPVLFLAALEKHGVYHDDVHVFRAGNFEQEAPTTPLRKKFIIDKLLLDGEFDACEMFDDSYSNLDEFMSLQKLWPGVEFTAYHVNHKGQVTKYRP